MTAAKELIDHAISSFSNTFQSLRDRVITLHFLKPNRVSKMTKETYVLFGKFDDAFAVYIR